MIDMVKGNYLFFGKHGDSVTSCMEACKRNDDCKTFTLFKTTFYRPFLRGICLGRKDVLDPRVEEDVANAMTGVLLQNRLCK
jgi:hypothetical protein